MASRQRRRREERRRRHAERGGWQTRHSVITGAGITAGALLGIASPAAAAPLYLTVTQPGDSGDGTCDATCTLRDAVEDGNANAGQYDYIYFGSSISGSVLTGGEIPITDSVGIYGNGPANTTITAAPNSRIFNVDPTTPGDLVGIRDIKLTGGDITGNGGAIWNEDAQLGIFDTVMTGNVATVAGGAIYDRGDGPIGQNDIIMYSTFSGNHAGSAGGAIFADDWGLLSSTTFVGNSAVDGYGGAIDGSSGYLVDSTISGNHAGARGGGLSVDGTDISLYGTILANNTAGLGDPDLNADGGTVGFDLVENPGTTGIGVVPSVITGKDPKLGGLANNGGAIPTLKPAAGSPVVDQSYSYSYNDQRFFDRTVDNPNRPNVAGGNGADIGAVELTLAEGPQGLPPGPAPTPTLTPTPAPHKKKCKKKKRHRSATSAKKKCKKKKRSVSSSGRFRFATPSRAASSWPDGAGQHPFRLGR
jgi:hypothetical protein